MQKSPSLPTICAVRKHHSLRPIPSYGDCATYRTQVPIASDGASASFGRGFRFFRTWPLVIAEKHNRPLRSAFLLTVQK